MYFNDFQCGRGERDGQYRRVGKVFHARLAIAPTIAYLFSARLAHHDTPNALPMPSNVGEASVSDNIDA